MEKRVTQLPSPPNRNHFNYQNQDNMNSPPRQRAMALIYKPSETINDQQNHNHSDVNDKKLEISTQKSSPNSEKNEGIGSPAPRMRTEYDFLMTYKPDNENKVS